MGGTTVTPIKDDSHFSDATSSLSSTTLAVIYFHAPWAAPCAQMSTVLSTLASTYEAESPPKITFLSIDAEELPELSETYDVTAVPYIVLQRDGKTLDTISGGDAAKVRASVEKHYSGSNASNGTNQLPPAQQVTRPAQQPAPPHANGDAAASSSDPTSTSGASGTGAEPGQAKAKNLSAYAPTSSDPQTAPQFSSSSTTSATQNTEPSSSTEDLNTRLSQLTNAAPVMLFMKGTPSAPQCGFSRQIVSILREHSVRYGFFNILADEEIRQGLKAYADWPTYPQLWMSGELVGGLDILKEELEGNAGFFDEYSVDTSNRNKGGPAAPELQKGPETEGVGA